MPSTVVLHILHFQHSDHWTRDHYIISKCAALSSHDRAPHLRMETSYTLLCKPKNTAAWY